MIIFWCWLSTLCPAKAWVLLQYRRSFNYNGSLFWYQWALRKSNGHNNSSGYHGHWKNSWSCFQIDRKNFTHVNEDFVLEDSTSALMLHIWDPLIANIQTGHSYLLRNLSVKSFQGKTFFSTTPNATVSPTILTFPDNYYLKYKRNISKCHAAPTTFWSIYLNLNTLTSSSSTR